TLSCILPRFRLIVSSALSSLRVFSSASFTFLATSYLSTTMVASVSTALTTSRQGVHISVTTNCTWYGFGILNRYFATVSLFRFWSMSTMVLFWMFETTQRGLLIMWISSMPIHFGVSKRMVCSSSLM